MARRDYRMFGVLVTGFLGHLSRSSSWLEPLRNPSCFLMKNRKANHLKKEDSTLTQMIEDAEEDLEMFDDCSFMDYDIEYTTEY